MNKSNIILYGADWCPDCKRSMFFLDTNKISYDYINIDNDPEATRKVEKINNGYKSIPTIIFPNGEILVEPSNPQLKKTLQNNNLI